MNGEKHKEYTAEEITEMADTWTNYQGFSGETCGECKKTANVFAYGPGWICECGHYNVQLWSTAQTVHEHPDMGPPRSVIIEGHKASKKLARIFAEVKHVAAN